MLVGGICNSVSLSIQLLLWLDPTTYKKLFSGKKKLVVKAFNGKKFLFLVVPIELIVNAFIDHVRH